MPLFSARYNLLFVDHGRVGCPERLDTSVETCLTCPRMIAIELNGPRPCVRCQNRRRPLMEFDL